MKNHFCVQNFTDWDRKVQITQMSWVGNEK